MLVRLFVIRGKANKESVAVSLPAVIGRSRDADLTIIHPMISRRHCQLFESEGLVKVRDLGSLNGTYLGGEQVQEAFLPPGAILTVGPLVFRVEYEASPAAICREPSVVAAQSSETPSDDVLIADEAHPESANGSQKTGGIPTHVVTEASGKHAEPATEPSPWQPSENPAIIHDVPSSSGAPLASIAPPDGAMPDFSAWQQPSERSGSQPAASSSASMGPSQGPEGTPASRSSRAQGDEAGCDHQHRETDNKSWADAPPPFTVVRDSDACLPVLLDSETNDSASGGGSSGGNILQTSGIVPSSRNVPADMDKGPKARRGWWFFRR